MSLVISTHTSSTRLLESFKIHFLSPVDQSLVTVSPTQLNFYSISSLDNKSLKPIETLRFNERIIACSHILPSGLLSEWILALTETNKLYVMAYNEQSRGFVIVQNFQFNDLLTPAMENRTDYDDDDDDDGAIHCVSVKPLIAVGPNQRFITIYSNESFVIVLELRPSKHKLFKEAVYEPKKIQKKKRSNLSSERIFEDPYILNIGIRHVHSMTFCNSELKIEKSYFGLIIRDENLRYHLELYEIKKIEKLEVKLIRKFVPMESNPSQVISVCPKDSGGLLVICERHQYFYSLPKLKLESDLDFKKTSGSICKTIYSPSEGVLEEFSSWCFVNDHKILLTSITGSHFIMEFRTRFVDQIEKEKKSLRNSTLKSDPPTLTVTDWNIKKIKTTTSFIINWIFKLNEEEFLGLNYYFKIFTSNLNISGESVIHIIHTGYNKPILDIISDHDFTYCSGDYQGSTIHYEDSSLEINGCCIKNCKIMEHGSLGKLFLLLTESKLINIDRGTVDTINILDVLDLLFNKLASYEFEENVIAFDLLCTGDMIFNNDKETYLQPSELANVSQILSNSFIIISNASSNDEDEDEDDMGDEKSEILMFYLDPEGELSLETMAVINKSVNLIFKWDKRNLLVFGSHSMHWLTLAFYKAAGEVKIKIDLLHNSLNFPVKYPSLVCKAGDQEAIIVADAFNGVYYIRLNMVKQRIRSVKLLQDKILSTALGFFGNDGLIVGDLLGNVYLHEVHTDGTTVYTQLIRQSNLCRGAITSIKGFSTGSTIREVIMLKKTKIAIIGTIEGCLINFYLSNERDSIIDILEQLSPQFSLPFGPPDELVLDRLEAQSSTRVLSCYIGKHANSKDNDTLELLPIDLEHTKNICIGISEDKLFKLKDMEAYFW